MGVLAKKFLTKSPLDSLSSPVNIVIIGSSAARLNFYAIMLEVKLELEDRPRGDETPSMSSASNIRADYFATFSPLELKGS